MEFLQALLENYNIPILSAFISAMVTFSFVLLRY